MASQAELQAKVDALEKQLRDEEAKTAAAAARTAELEEKLATAAAPSVGPGAPASYKFVKFPMHVYHKDAPLEPREVNSDAEIEALGEGWFPSPALARPGLQTCPTGKGAHLR